MNVRTDNFQNKWQITQMHAMNMWIRYWYWLPRMTILRLVASLKKGFTIVYAMGKIFGADEQNTKQSLTVSKWLTQLQVVQVHWTHLLVQANFPPYRWVLKTCVQYNAVRLWNMDSYKTLWKPNPVLWEKMLPEDSKDRMDTKGH